MDAITANVKRTTAIEFDKGHARVTLRNGCVYLPGTDEHPGVVYTSAESLRDLAECLLAAAEEWERTGPNY